MTQQDDITQRVLTGDETRAAMREARSMTAPSDTTEPGDYVMAGARALLSKLRAPVPDSTLPLEQALHELVDKIVPGLDTGDLVQDARRASTALSAILASAPVADERALDLLDTLFTAYENGTPCYEEPDSQGGYLGMAFRIDDDTFRACADLLNKERPRTAGALASAPVADERAAQEYGSPADVAQRIEQYLAQDGRMNSGTQLLYEAMKALRASQGDRNDG